MPVRTKRKAAVEPVPTLRDYVEAFCDADPSSRGDVVRLSGLLAKVVGGELAKALPGYIVRVGHRKYGGVIRRHHLDIFVSTDDLGLQVGIDVKGLNSRESVGKNWPNRVGDLHEMSANHHDKFPYAVMGGVLAIPHGVRAEQLANIERSMERLGGRRVPADPKDQMESLALLVIDKDKRQVVPDVPAPDSPLRYEKFVPTVVERLLERRH